MEKLDNEKLSSITGGADASTVSFELFCAQCNEKRGAAQGWDVYAEYDKLNGTPCTLCGCTDVEIRSV